MAVQVEDKSEECRRSWLRKVEVQTLMKELSFASSFWRIDLISEPPWQRKMQPLMLWMIRLPHMLCLMQESCIWKVYQRCSGLALPLLVPHGHSQSSAGRFGKGRGSHHWLLTKTKNHQDTDALEWLLNLRCCRCLGLWPFEDWLWLDAKETRSFYLGHWQAQGY